MNAPGSAGFARTTKETRVEAELTLAPGPIEIDTGIGFLDHMLTSLAFHAGFALRCSCAGDLRVDDHHTVEDCAIAFGAALDRALGDRNGIARFGTGFAPLDEALARAVVDLSGRPAWSIELALARDSIGGVATENLTHWFAAFAARGKLALHLDLLRGDNDHHKAEAAFKALALALAEAVRPSARGVPSVKGSLDAEGGPDE